MVGQSTAPNKTNPKQEDPIQAQLKADQLKIDTLEYQVALDNYTLANVELDKAKSTLSTKILEIEKTYNLTFDPDSRTFKIPTKTTPQVQNNKANGENKK